MAQFKTGDVTSFNAFDYFFWIPWLVPHLGGIIGAIFYLVMVGAHHRPADALAN